MSRLGTVLREKFMLLRENVYEMLRSDILACRLAPGDDMREQELAERYAVSRQPVREALLRLEREHLVTVQPRQGYRVNPISLSDARDLLRFRSAPFQLRVSVYAAPLLAGQTDGTARSRKPKWLPQSVGSSLFRNAAAQRSALLCQLPPRITRSKPCVEEVHSHTLPWRS